MRPKFVKGTQSVFLWRFFKIFSFHRGSQDFLTWITRFRVLRKRVLDAWQDLFEEATDTDSGFTTAYAQAEAQATRSAPAPTRAAFLKEYNEQLEKQHKAEFPLNDNLWALTFYCLADLKEDQRERLGSHLHMKDYKIKNYTFELIAECIIDLHCMPKNSIDNPSMRTGDLR